MVILKVLLELQLLDTALLQLQHQVVGLPQRKAFEQAKSDMLNLEGNLTKVSKNLVTSQNEIEQLEHSNKDLESTIARYSSQLKATSASREAEVLQHEIEVARTERSNNDDQELSLLEAADQLVKQQALLSEQILVQRNVIESASKDLAESIEHCQTAKGEIETKREQISAQIEPKLLKLYLDKSRNRKTPAVADLHGVTCKSCHLDLTTGELVALRKLAETEIPVCPNCDCYLVL